MDVRYFPQIKKNTISVRAVESKKLKMMLENGILKVTKRVLGCDEGDQR